MTISINCNRPRRKAISLAFDSVSKTIISAVLVLILCCLFDGGHDALKRVIYARKEVVGSTYLSVPSLHFHSARNDLFGKRTLVAETIAYGIELKCRLEAGKCKDPRYYGNDIGQERHDKDIVATSIGSFSCVRGEVDLFGTVFIVERVSCCSNCD